MSKINNKMNLQLILRFQIMKHNLRDLDVTVVTKYQNVFVEVLRVLCQIALLKFPFSLMMIRDILITA